MKKQRIQNPRFLAALGALGFLGLLGSQQPEVQQWARLSWLSLLSFLVLIPTVDVNSRWANHRFNPRRKWMLVFLLFLGFLGFLGTEYGGLHGLAWLAALTQFSIDQKKKDSERAPPHSVLVQAAIGTVFAVMAITLIVAGVPLAGVALVFLVFPFIPIFSSERKDRLPLRELRWILVFLTMAIILPVAGITWFMSAAMRNERAAVRQQVSELQQSQVRTAIKRMDEEVERLQNRLVTPPDLSAPERFNLLVQEQLGDSILIFSKEGMRLAYPKPTVSCQEAESSPEGLDLKTRITALIRSENWQEAKALLETMVSDETLRVACDSSGRNILSALLLFYVQSNPVDAEVLEMLRNRILDYSTPMPSVRRVFYLKSLAELGVAVEPWLRAEQLALEAENDPLLPAFKNKPGLARLKDSNLVMLYNGESKAAVLFREPALIERLQAIIDASVALANIRLVLEGKGEKGNPDIVVSRVWDTPGFGWKVNLYEDGDGPLPLETGRRVLVYLLTGCGLIVVISIVAALLVRSLLAQQRLNQMKNDFVATVTHELKTPLASTRMLIDTLLEGRCKSDDQQREYLELIARENKRLSRLIDNFLTFSRMERNKRAFNLEDVAPGELANAAVETVHENYEQCGCKLTVNIDENLPLIVADRDSMVQVLLNLLDNGCKYSNGDKCIQLRVFEKEHAVCFQVKDNGIGISKRDLSKIMERFYQVDQSMTRTVGGAGLGLSIVQFIVEAHGATIQVESELGKGSVFTVEVPVDAREKG